MLYDPKWKDEPNLLSLDNLISWLEMQPAKRTYNYIDSSECLVAEYLKAMGQESFDYACLDDFSRDFAIVANSGDPVDTYGAALNRARALLDHRQWENSHALL